MLNTEPQELIILLKVILLRANN